MIEITTPSRIHMTLIDMNGEIGRVDGGAGLTLSSPNIKITAEEAEGEGVIIEGLQDFADRMKRAAESLLPEGKGIRINVKEVYPAHVGFGSGTQSSLAAAAAVNELYGLNKSVRELAIAVKRGGTSGIGVTAFERGGFIVDGGHRFKDKGGFMPSAASPAPPGPVLFREDFPEWDMVVAIPKDKGMHDQAEIDTFKKFCPIPIEEVREIAHVVLMQMMPAVIEKDIVSFGAAVNHVQTVGFNKRESLIWPDFVKNIASFMRSRSYGAGVSSFGPVVYSFVDNKSEARQLQAEVQEMLNESVGGSVILTKAKNTGAEISKV
ncbi:MAG: beta-ribofuranosylaminobenzene 5'-phosphate synthase [Methanosarcina thermophila]|jgi:beta-ribofuranosylaminobenzene 5'-phosphate synthase|uniref:Beta-ribofuranosylaminobenzene 5'-phosphate synthase n=3 Tax=Methanosarcina thermophila TaxID=2210 RepID=A0A1I6X7Z8_METTE|nr:beta-ribofuranosylaminobenzene 5'-phosphate synthase [Methanosarcina thermophila]ALK04605.1 MAG: beta-ribofuranosylaminobenzene 5'-phosphate synthase [Methanosarcina sp. 795]AKB13273.1 beta-ribofuranosylaminobenzene 5'-phosphate synthase [Methanosarcina thermophila TM-1]AKB16092.1 beta-ribofuranosylaminobenzene 5'-phosphate synthase [Methanosarcina thermophila CHTI-55]NLU57231.1 beta-ribofuranosylaminobenzene 5'-phosphate synthase [Methanosarcina thermophila]SFT34430.1 beta-ribofuranosylami